MFLLLRNIYINKNYFFVLDFKLIEDIFFMYMMYDLKKNILKIINCLELMKI